MTDKKRLERLGKIQTTLIWTLVMNVGVCVLKIVLGLATGIFTITADGLHSLGDSFSNVVGLAGIRLAKKEPDKQFGYGYDKFEPIVTLFIVSLISVTCYEVFKSGIARLFRPHHIAISGMIIAIMLISMAVNVATIIYEGGVGRRLKSELLIADSNETKSDLWVSGGVILGVLVIGKTGWWQLDGILSIAIGFLILRVIWGIIVPTAKALADAQVVLPEKVAEMVMATPGARFCHAIRSRGRGEGFYLDLHLGVDKNLSIERAHDDVCHRVKIALHAAFPGLKSANVHIEPDNESGRSRSSSVSRESDPYGYTT